MPEEVPGGVPLVEADVARGLLEERDPDARVLERLRRDVRGALHGDVRGAELRDGVVAVADEDAVVERARPPQRFAVVRRRSAAEEALGETLFAHELVEEDAPQALGGPAVAREERAGHFLRELEAEDGRVDVREEALQDVRFVPRELRRHVPAILDRQSARIRTAVIGLSIFPSAAPGAA